MASLNEWLKNRALKNERSGASRTYVLCAARRVIGYHCLATGAVDHDGAPNPLRRNMPDPIPVLVLGRLAIDRQYQNRNLGRALVRDAIVRATQAAEIVGAVALLVHALSEEARRFYRSCGFIDFPAQPMTLCLLMRTAYQTRTRPVRN
ncbi:GNAT family N-acetyltransferase [Fimbriiglobus ruber]|uniref:GNAT family N-acetyltransferase n=1 Tax=Fimbriiglobus ruber TaxID=1908690 RepID=UPI001EE75B40|nr:GNAT family N-acetyltransferase [Fimbriiglobus ruber]